MNAFKETVKLLKEYSEDQLVELFNEIDDEETAILVREAADFFLRKKAEEEADLYADPCCEQEWREMDYARRYREAQQ